MPRFYFDVREGSRFFADHEGHEMSNVEAAEQEAAESAAAIGQDRLPSGEVRDVTVEVRNEHGQRLVTAKVTLEVHRVDPSPLPPDGSITREFA
jgi:hypothetical protein